MKTMIITLLTLFCLFFSPLSAQDRPEDAVKVESGRTAEQYYNIANWYSERNQYFKAIAYYKAAIRQDAGFCQALINMGLAYKEVRRFDDAVAAYRQALDSKCSQEFIHLNLGNTLVAAERYQEGLAAYDTFIEKQPYDPDGYLNKGITLFKMKQYAKAAEAFEKLILLEPDNAYFIFQTARCHARLGNFDKTALRVMSAYQVDPNIRYPLMADEDFREFRKSEQFRKIRERIALDEPQE